MDTCPTVKIKAANKAGYVLMNASDFDPARHERFANAPASLPPPPAAPPAAVAPPVQQRETLKLKGKA